MAGFGGTAASLVFPFADRDGHGFPLLGLMDFDRLIVVNGIGMAPKWQILEFAVVGMRILAFLNRRSLSALALIAIWGSCLVWFGLGLGGLSWVVQMARQDWRRVDIGPNYTHEARRRGR